MPKLIFVIGAAASGKTYFIEENYKDKGLTLLNVYDYQQRAYDEAGFGGSMIPMGAQIQCLMKANQMLLEDVIMKLSEGCDVVVEHTLFKAKRRIAYIDEIRKAADVTIDMYVMNPSDALWESNLHKREPEGSFERYKAMFDDIEFPNVSEGIDHIYEVVDGEIKLRMEPQREGIVLAARKELAEESEKIAREEEEKRKRKELLESMKKRAFWHYCEVCGKKELITAQQAFDAGWDYPPNIGYFGLLGPRTCGDCGIEDTLFWKISKNSKLPIVMEGNLTPEELVTWKRIKGEPESLLDDIIGEAGGLEDAGYKGF